MITTDGYREKSSETIIFMCIIEKVTAIGRVTAIGYRPAIGCNIYSEFTAQADKSLEDGVSQMSQVRLLCNCMQGRLHPQSVLKAHALSHILTVEILSME